MTSEELQDMSRMTFDDVRGDDILPVGGVSFDKADSVSERIKLLLATGKNPYFRRAEDGAVIKISFTDNGRSFEDNLVALLTEKQGAGKS